MVLKGGWRCGLCIMVLTDESLTLETIISRIRRVMDATITTQTAFRGHDNRKRAMRPMIYITSLSLDTALVRKETECV